MKIISPLFESLINTQNPSYTKKVLFYPRKWSGSLNKYIEADAVDITKYIIEISAVKWKLDNEGYSVWNNANTTLTLGNFDDKFTEGNCAGFLPSTEYIFHGSRMEIYAGVAPSESGKEYIKIFRGFIYASPVIQESERTLTITLSGELAKLDTYSAQDIALVSENELIGQDSGNEFNTQNSAVGSVIKVSKGLLSAGPSAASELREENDYQVSSLASNTRGAQIKLTLSLNPGEAVWADYRYWHTNKTLEWIAQSVATVAGITSFEIDSIAYNDSVEYSFKQPLDFPFSDGEFKETAEDSGSITLPTDYLKIANYNWAILENPSGVAFTLTPSSVSLSQNPFSGHATVCAPAQNAYGTWEVEANCNWEGMENQFNYFVSTTNNRTTTCGYAISCDKYDWYYIFEFYRIDNGVRTWIEEKDIQFRRAVVRYRYKMSRNKKGEFHFWAKPIHEQLNDDWTYFGILATDNTYTVSNYNMIVMENYGYNHIYEIKLSPSAASGTGNVCPEGSYLSPVIDGGATIKGWGAFSFSQEVPAACSGSTFWRAKTLDTDPWSNWQAVASGSAPDSLGRYMQLKWDAKSNPAQTLAPKLNSWQLSWEGAGVNIAIVNTAGMSCLDVMRELAQLTGFQIGFDTEGKFLFKARTTGEPVRELTEKDIISIENISDGADKIYNRVTVNFGTYSRSLDCSADPHPNLIDRYGVKELTLSSGALLPPQNANLARAVAPGVYNHVKQIKKRAVVVTKFLPQIELNDVLRVNCKSLNLDMQVEGIEFNLTDWTLRLDLTEI